MNELQPLIIPGAILLASGLIVAIWFLGRRRLRQLPPMLPLPIHSLFLYCTLFTIGVMLLSTRAAVFVPLGLLLCMVGLAIFLPERLAMGFLSIFLLLLALSLLAVLQQLRTDQPLVQPQRLSVGLAGFFGAVWGMGLLFAWERWNSGQTGIKTTAKHP